MLNFNFNQYKGRIALAILFIIIVLVLQFAGIGKYINIATIKAHKAYLQQFVAQHYAFAVFIYISFFTLASFLSIPVTIILNLVAGFFFGAFTGTDTRAARSRVETGSRRDRSRLATCARRNAEGGTQEIPGREPLVTVCGDQGQFPRGGSRGWLGMESAGAVCLCAGCALLCYRAGVFPRGRELAGVPRSGFGVHFDTCAG